MVHVLDPATLGHHREVAAELARDGRQPSSDLVARQGPPLGDQVVVDRVSAGSQSASACAFDRDVSPVDGELAGDREGQLLPRDHVADEVARRPSMRRRDGHVSEASDTDSNASYGRHASRSSSRNDNPSTYMAVILSARERPRPMLESGPMSDDLVPPLRPSTPRRPGARGKSHPELLASLLTSGDDELAAWTLRHALREASRAVVYDGLLKDAMRLVGERWATGRWSVADEHLASRTLMRALEQVRPKLGPESRWDPWRSSPARRASST